jgi:hypothetical protein
MNSKSTTSAAIGALACLALLASCQAPAAGPGLLPSLSLAAVPQGLARPSKFDWTLQRVSSKALQAARKAHFKTLAFPSASAGWNGGPGLALTAFGAAAGDYAPNGPAAAFRQAGDPLFGQVFFLSKNGRFVKVDRSTGAGTSLALGKTFSRTFVTLSPNCNRAYLLADDGTFFVVDTIGMTTLATKAVGGGYGIAPWVDPYTYVANTTSDSTDEVYVAANDGNVHKFVVAPAVAPAVTVAGPTTYAISTGVTPLYAGTRKIAAPPVVLGGVIHIGDMGGNFNVYDTTNAANNFTYGMGAPVTTAPAIEIQDGSYTLTDPTGAPKTVPAGAPVYAFVAAGGSCAWVNLADTSITRSLALRVDDNDGAQKFGYLRNYTFSSAGTTEYVAARDGGNINTDTAAAPANQVLPNYASNISNDYIVPAETNVYDNGTQASGGPVVSYLRWQGNTYAAGSTIAQATLSLTAFADQGCRVPEIRSASPYYLGTSTLWASDALTNANRPVVGGANAGVYLSGGINGAGNVTYKANKQYLWDVTSEISTPSADGRYALALKYNTPQGDAVYWPWGPYGAAVGKKAKKAYAVESVEFKNNPLNADPSPGVNKDDRPYLELVVSTTVLPTPSIETAPVIDSSTHRVYVFYTNTMFSISYNNPTEWADANPAAPFYTLMQASYYGDTANGGGTFNGNKNYVGNFTSPVLNYDTTAAYVISRYPAVAGATPASWNYALSKITLPLNAAASTLVGSSPTFANLSSAANDTGASPEASGYLIVDPFSFASNGGNVFFALPNGRLYQYDK